MDDFELMGEGHCSQIIGINNVIGKHVCDGCQKMFIEARHLQQHHDGHCRKGEPKYSYPGGMYQRKWTIFEQLGMWGIIVSKQDQLCESFVTWDCEALLVQVEKMVQRQTIDEQIEQRLNDQNMEVEYNDQARRLQIRERHVVATCAMKSTVPGAEETQFFANQDPEVLIEDVHQAMNRISDLNYEQQRQKYVKIFDRLEEYRQENFKLQAEEKAQGNDTRPLKHGMRVLDHLLKKMERFCRQLTILTFNGGRYDLNLVKKYLIPKLVKDVRQAKTMDRKGYHPFPKAISRGTNVMSLSTEKLKFLDVINYCSPGTSLDKFIKAYNPDGDQKAIFPYELLRSYDALETTTEFPPKSAFYSTLKNKNITDQEYEEARQVWNGLETKNLMAFIREYNSKDVEPFLEAVKKQMKIYWNDFDVDIFKEAISIPGVCMAFLFKRLEQVHLDVKFGLFSEVEADLSQELYGPTSLCGGLSFIGQRIASKGVTEIKRATYDDLEKMKR